MKFDFNISTAFQFLRAYLWAQAFFIFVFGSAHFLGGLRWGKIGLIASPFLSLICSIAIVMFSDKMGSFVSSFYGKRLPFTLRERLVGDIDKVRHFKMKKEYETALRIVNDVIIQDPNHPEALLLKAGILWEGYGNAGAAKGILKKISEKSPDIQDIDESVLRWASNLRDEIDKKTLA